MSDTSLGPSDESCERQATLQPTALQREVMRPTSDRGRLAALATICSMAGVALGFALAGTMFASIPMATRMTPTYCHRAQVRPAPAWIGVTTSDHRTQPGAWIKVVHPYGPAEHQLAPGDLVTGLDRQRIVDSDALVSAVRRHAPGTAVTLTVRRGTQQLERTLILETMPDAAWRAEQAATLRRR